MTTYTWSKNPDLDKLMTFEKDPYGVFEPRVWDSVYELVWYIDPRFNPLPDKVWAMRCRPVGKIEGVKDMGYLVPNVNVEYNNELPDLGVDVDQCCPAFWELENECAWELDPIHTPNNRMWVVKYSPAYRKPKSWQWYGIISPEYHIEYNPDLPNMEYDLDYIIPWHDLTYEHVWMLDRKHLLNDEADIWAFKIKVSNDIEVSKTIDYISPNINIEYNPDLPKMKFDLDYIIPWHDLTYGHAWCLDDTEKTWAIKMSATNNPTGIKEMPDVKIVVSKQLDVIFISYHEPNAEENWQRVLEKAPWAKRVDGVEGIFQAHKAAAKLSTTDMFYVVDGDAWLVDDFNFDFQPNIYDRDCTHVWRARNPINGLVYGYGGVKLFPKQALMKMKTWKTLDLSMSANSKIKIINKISNITAFDTDALSVWRSAFRECVKLCYNIKQDPTDHDSQYRLEQWTNKDTDHQLGKYARNAAQLSVEWTNNNYNDLKTLKLINNRKWIENMANINE